MSVQMNTGIHLFLQEPLLRTLLISGEVGTGKTHALLQVLHHRERSYTTITSHADMIAMHEVVDIQRTLETAQIVRQAHPWDVYDLLICEGLDHFDRSMWLRILYEQNRRYEAGRPLQIIGTYTGTEGLSQWVYDMDLWIPIESPDRDTRVRVLADRDQAETVLDAPSIPTVHDSIYTYISSVVERFNISFMGMEYILLKASIGLAREKGHPFVEPIDVEDVLPWTLPQKMKILGNYRIQQDGETHDSSDPMPSDETSTEQEKLEEASSNRGNDNISQGVDRENNRAEQIGRTYKGMISDSDEPYDEPSKEGNTVESEQTESELDTGHDGAEEETDTNGEGQRKSHRGMEESSFTLSEAVETQVLDLYGMLQSEVSKKKLDISADSRGPKVHRQGSTGRTIAWIPTIVQGIVRSRQLPLRLTIDDIRYAMHKETPKEAIYLVVDSSGSMGQRKRLEETEKLLSQCIQMMYVKRQYVSLITFQKQGAQCVVPLTSHIETIPNALESVRIGGRTPFVKGVEEAVQQIVVDMSQLGPVQAKVVIITDGKVTSQALQGLDDIGRWLTNQGIQTTIIDTDTSFVRMNRAKEIAYMLRAEYVRIQDI